METGNSRETFIGKDGVVPAVQLRDGESYLERTAQNLYPLELRCHRKCNYVLADDWDYITSLSEQTVAVIADIAIKGQATDENIHCKQNKIWCLLQTSNGRSLSRI